MAQTIALLVNTRTGHEYNIQRYSASIGREIGNDIPLPTDKTISRQHAFVCSVDGRYYVEDAGSKNGTWLNGDAITSRVELVSGDEIRVGITRLLFLLVPDRFSPDADISNPASNTQTLIDTVIPVSRSTHRL